MRTALETKQTARARVRDILVGARVRTAALVTELAAYVTGAGLTTIAADTFGRFNAAAGNDVCSITAGLKVLTSTDNPWTAGDVGKAIDVAGAGVAGGTLRSVIDHYTGAGSVTLRDAAATTVAASVTSAGGLAVWGYPYSLALAASPIQNEAGDDLQSLSPAVAGGAGRSLSADLSPVFNICDFGAVAGTTDSGPAIAAAIAAAVAAGGGVVYVPPGIFTHTAPIALAPAVTLRGAGCMASTLKSAHTGDGVSMTSPINSSTAVYTVCEHLRIWNTNAANTGGGYVDVGGTYAIVRNVHVWGFKFGVIFDQTELSDILDCLMANQTGACIWMVNSDEHTPLASYGFTNRVTVQRCQLSAAATAPAVVDDGGYAHAYRDNNYNGSKNHLVLAGTKNCMIDGGEFETAASHNILSNVTSYFGAQAMGQNVNLIIQNACIVPTAGHSCLSCVSGAPITLIGNYFGATAVPKIVGTANCYSMILVGNFSADGGVITDYPPAATGMSVDMLYGVAFGQGIGSSWIKDMLTATGALAFDVSGAVPGQATDISIAVVGAAVGDPVTVAPGAALPAGCLLNAWVDSANVVKVRLAQLTGAAAAHNLGNGRVTVWKHA